MPLVSKVRERRYRLHTLIYANPVYTVSDALVRYINQGTTIGSVNLPDIQHRSLTLEEGDVARVNAQFHFVSIQSIH